MLTSTERALPNIAVAMTLLLLAAMRPAVAQTADIQVQIAVSNGNTYVTPSRAVRIRTEATNLGPDNLSAVDIRFLTTTPSANSIDAAALNGCVASQGPGTVVNMTWAVGPLPVGATAVCEIELTARPSAQPAVFIFRAEVIVSGFIDPVLNNGRPLIDLLTVSPIDIVQDMVLAIRSPPGILRTPPNLSPVDFELSNRGPDAFPPNWRHLLRSEAYRFTGGGAESFLLFSTGDPDCDLFNDDVGNSRIDQINFTNPIPPGTSQTCTLAVAARPNATGSRSLRWDVGRLTPGLLETNPADNTAFLVMQFSPAIIPVDARWALLLLIAGLGALGGWRLRRARG